MRILLGVPVHQDVDIFKEYLKSLDRLKVPDDCQLDRCFFLHNCEELEELLLPTDIVLLNDTPADFKTDGITHVWKEENLREVARMKNFMIQLALDEGYDYYFLVDSDLILHPDTLQVLLDREKEIVAEIFWTEWMAGSNTLGPNCWDMDHYGIENSHRYMVPGLHEVGGTGALILIKREVLERGVNYTPIYNVSFTAWEDRAFCIRAAVHGYQIYIDTTLPARHLYRRNEYEKYIAAKQKGGAPA